VPARQLFVQVLLLLAVLGGANGAVACFSRYTSPRQKLRSIEDSRPADVLFLGNSVMDAGADCGAFESSWPGRHALNLGLASSGPVEHLLLLRAARRHAGAVVVYGFFDLQLTDPLPGGWEDLTGNRSMAYYADLEAAIAFYAPDSPLRALQMRLVSRVPILVERTRIWAEVEKLRRRLGRIGLPAEEATGPAHLAALMEWVASDPVQIREAAERRAPLIEPIKALFAVARARGSEVLIVEMPMRMRYWHPVYETPAWLLYRRHVQALVRQEGGNYLVASDWIADEGFEDHLHLNASGAAAFSRRLAETMRAR
jgi:hypothetical protein